MPRCKRVCIIYNMYVLYYIILAPNSGGFKSKCREVAEATGFDVVHDIPASTSWVDPSGVIYIYIYIHILHIYNSYSIIYLYIYILFDIIHILYIYIY